jgi:hypothetical protein
MKLSREAIERVLGKQPPVPIIEEQPRGTWRQMTDAECKAIIEAKRQNPTFTYRELAKKFKRSNSVIWDLINGGKP